MDFYTKLRAKKIDTIYHNYHRYNKMKVENHWFDPGRAKNEKSRCFHDHYYPLIDQMPSCVDTTSRNIDSLSISLRNLRSMVLPPSHRHVYIYIFTVHCNRHVNKSRWSDGPTSNHCHFLGRGEMCAQGLCARRLLVGRSDVVPSDFCFG